VAVVCQPHIITKSLLLKKESDVNRFLVTAILVEILFFSVIIAGLYARIAFPNLTVDGQVLKNDGIIPTYVIKAFSSGWVSVTVGLFVILGLISAGMSTLEGLIQSISTTITTDIIKPIFGKSSITDKRYIFFNRISIVIMAIVAFFITRDQLITPKLSVAILAQNGVYAYFSVIFMPIVLGVYGKNVGLNAPLFASLTAFVTHFGVYYLLPFLLNKGIASFGLFNRYLEGPVRNPAIAASTAIILSVIVGLIVHLLERKPRIA